LISAPPVGASGARPRVLIVTHLYPTPQNPLKNPWIEEQVGALSASADIRVLCPTLDVESTVTETQGGVGVEYRPTGTRLGRGRLGLIGSTFRYDRALTDYLRIHAKELDVIHAHFGFPDAVVVARAAERFDLRFVLTLHGDDAFRVLPMRGPVGVLARRAAKRADAVICVSDQMELVAKSCLGDDARVVVIPNGYDDSIFRLSESPRDREMLFVGRLGPVKNVDILLRAVAVAGPRFAFRMTIVGDGPLRLTLESLARDLGVADRVRFVGEAPRAAVASFMSRSACLLLPSRSEGLPLVVIEALACGTPVIASDVGGLRELVRTATAGYLVRPGDVEELAAALIDFDPGKHRPADVLAASGVRPWKERVVPISDLYRALVSRSTRGF
jgi:teichuronic acid biosynthesis glycosyltransferase TuaC